MNLKRTLALLSVMALTLAMVGCTRLEEMTIDPVLGEDASGRITFEMALSIPTDSGPATKAMGETADISNIYIAVFGSNNYLNEFVKAIPLTAGGDMNLDSQGNYVYAPVGGLYKVRFSLKPTSSRRHVHILANVPETLVPPDFGYVDEVLGKNLFSSDGQDGYWQYLEFSTGISNSSADRFDNVKLVRNFAKVTLEAAPASGFTVKGFELYNTPTRGSFAPYMGKTVAGSNITYYFYTTWEDAGNPKDYADVRAAYDGYLMPGATPLYRPSYGAGDFPAKAEGTYCYTYEHPADEENASYIIAKLEKDGVSKFYRLDILDDLGRKSPLLRNYCYTLTIAGIATDGYSTPAEAELHPSDYNFTLSAETQDIKQISNYGAYLEASYVEKVYTVARTGEEFKYRYTAELTASPTYSAGKLSAISGDGEVTAHWDEGDSGTDSGDGWYTVTFDVKDPSAIGSDEVISSFTVTGGEGKTMIHRVVNIISMKKKALIVTEWSQSGTDLTLKFTVPEGLRASMFPLHFKFVPKDIDGNQVLSPQDGGLVSHYETTSDGSIIYFVKDYFYTDYETSRDITIHFKSPTAIYPAIEISDLDDYFEPLEMGGAFATGLAAKSIAKGTGYRTTLEFVSATTAPMQIALTNLTAVSSDTGTLSGSGSSYTYTPTEKGTQRIVLEATTPTSVGTVTITLVTPDPTLPRRPEPLTVSRYDKYVAGELAQSAELPLGTGKTTTFSFNYSARDLMPVTITATGVDVSLAAGTGGTLEPAGSGTYTYTPDSQGDKSFTITSKTNFQSAGTISLSMPYMTNPAALTVQRATSFVIPTGAIILDDATDFNPPLYWRTNKVNSTSGTVGSSSYFDADEAGDGANTGNISIDVSSFTKADNTKVYFVYSYTQRVLLIPRTKYKNATTTLGALISATPESPVTLTFE